MRDRSDLDRLVAEEISEAPEVDEETREEYRSRLEADEETAALVRRAQIRRGRYHVTDEEV